MPRATTSGGRNGRRSAWRELAALGYPGRIVWTEYDQWPRGRIVYQTPTQRFVLYADRRLQQPTIIDALKTAFGLNDAKVKVIVRSDSHYR